MLGGGEDPSNLSHLRYIQERTSSSTRRARQHGIEEAIGWNKVGILGRVCVCN